MLEGGWADVPPHRSGCRSAIGIGWARHRGVPAVRSLSSDGAESQHGRTEVSAQYEVSAR